MGQLLADALPENLKQGFAERNITIGSVIKIYDKIAKKEKWHLIVGISDNKLLTASVRINSNLNTNCIPASLRVYHFHITKKENLFLEHDSYVDCSKLLIHEIKDFISCIKSNAGNLLGQMPEKELDHVRATIAICPVIAQKQKAMFNLQ
ncbi:MAG: hypothetical protein LBT61_02895 [Prevotellaceae bacterium]|jgi:CRISPR/Cas system CMR subunit Cmr6 (Cas7 group RAMP superfamily)|nr:hypothetical protein [Prevotellaceae bacterium]